MGFLDDISSAPIGTSRPSPGKATQFFRPFSGKATQFFQQFSPEFLDPLAQGTPGFEKFRQQALRGGPSPFAQLQEQQSLREEALARQDLLTEAGTRGAEAQAELASKGGITSGAAERIEQEATRAAIFGGQEVGQQGVFNRLKIRLEDESQRQADVKSLAQIELQNEQARNEFALSRFKDLAALFGAEQQAQAIRASGGSRGPFSSFFGGLGL